MTENEAIIQIQRKYAVFQEINRRERHESNIYIQMLLAIAAINAPNSI
jgi:hypothetical protein